MIIVFYWNLEWCIIVTPDKYSHTPESRLITVPPQPPQPPQNATPSLQPQPRIDDTDDTHDTHDTQDTRIIGFIYMKP